MARTEPTCPKHGQKQCKKPHALIDDCGCGRLLASTFQQGSWEGTFPELIESFESRVWSAQNMWRDFPLTKTESLQSFGTKSSRATWKLTNRLPIHEPDNVDLLKCFVVYTFSVHLLQSTNASTDLPRRRCQHDFQQSGIKRRKVKRRQTSFEHENSVWIDFWCTKTRFFKNKKGTPVITHHSPPLWRKGIHMWSLSFFLSMHTFSSCFFFVCATRGRGRQREVQIVCFSLLAFSLFGIRGVMSSVVCAPWKQIFISLRWRKNVDNVKICKPSRSLECLGFTNSVFVSNPVTSSRACMQCTIARTTLSEPLHLYRM